MTKTKRKWDRLTEEQRQVAIDGLIQYVDREMEEKIGVIAAEQLLNYVLQTVGTQVYNRGLADAKITVERRMEDLQFDLDDLQDI